MTTIHDPLKCGNCGGDEFKLVNVRPVQTARAGGAANGRVFGTIWTVCMKCSARSTIAIQSQAMMTIHGELCGGWLDDNETTSERPN
jgi:hypothetical protein